MSFRYRNVNSWRTSFGARLKPPTMSRSIRQIIVHEHYADYVMSHEYDIAVAQISPPVQFTADVHRVCLPEAQQVFPDNTTCFVTGWGALKDDGEKCFMQSQANSPDVCFVHRASKPTHWRNGKCTVQT